MKRPLCYKSYTNKNKVIMRYKLRNKDSIANTILLTIPYILLALLDNHNNSLLHVFFYYSITKNIII